MGSDTMKAVVFKGPGKVVIEDRPVPKIKDQTDIIVKVDKVQPKCVEICPQANILQTALCGRYIKAINSKHNLPTNFTQ
jgi:hypothetical protein